MANSLSITKEINHLEKVRKEFVTNKELVKQVVGLQLAFASMLVGLLNLELERLENKKLTAEEEACLRSRDKIGAIKLVKARLNYGLGEAKKYVEDVAAEMGYGYYKTEKSNWGEYTSFYWK